MLRRFIEYRERAFHGRENNRKSLPFEWGLEHIGVPSVINGGDPCAILSEYVSQALTDSAAFYAHEPTTEYDFDGHILRFPSSVQTPYPANNLVWGRYFGGHGRLAAVVLPQWNCKWEGQVGLCRVLQR